jgi:hypothetical protein
VKSALLLIVCAAGTVFGVVMATRDVWPGWPLAMFFGAGFIGQALQLAGHGSRLIIARDDFTIGSFRTTETHAWSDIESVTIVSWEHTRAVRFRSRNGGERILDDDFGLGVDELARLFAKRAAEAAAPTLP